MSLRVTRLSNQSLLLCAFLKPLYLYASTSPEWVLNGSSTTSRHYKLMIWSSWLRGEERENNAEGNSEEAVERMQCILCYSCLFHHFCLQDSRLLISLSSLLFPSIPFTPPRGITSFPSFSHPFFTLPRWYLIAVKQEAGEQTAGEPTLILSSAICCSHMTELQARSNTMMPHHIWRIDQSPPTSKTESKRAGTVEWRGTPATINAVSSGRHPANYDLHF